VKKYLFLFFVYILSTLACSLTPTYTKSTPSALPPVTVTVNAPVVEFVQPTPITTLTPSVRWMVAVGDVNVRESPSADGRVMAWLLEGQGVEVFAIADGWAQVKDGYIKAEWLEDDSRP